MAEDQEPRPYQGYSTLRSAGELLDEGGWSWQVYLSINEVLFGSAYGLWKPWEPQGLAPLLDWR